MANSETLGDKEGMVLPVIGRWGALKVSTSETIGYKFGMVSDCRVAGGLNDSTGETQGRNSGMVFNTLVQGGWGLKHRMGGYLSQSLLRNQLILAGFQPLCTSKS